LVVEFTSAAVVVASIASAASAQRPDTQVWANMTLDWMSFLSER